MYWYVVFFLTNAGLLPLETNLNDILVKMHFFSFPKMHLNRSSAKWRLFCPGKDELKASRFRCWNKTILGEIGQHHCCSNPRTLRDFVTSIGRHMYQCYHLEHNCLATWINHMIVSKEALIFGYIMKDLELFRSGFILLVIIWDGFPHYHEVYPIRYTHGLVVQGYCVTVQWRHNEHDGVSNQRRLDCLLKRLF